jgi:hypothetical protein
MARPEPITPETEASILIYLFEHPNGQHTTYTLAEVLEENSTSHDEAVLELKAVMNGVPQKGDTVPAKIKPKRKPSDVQADVESLIVKGLVAGGKRTGKPDNITHTDIQLTQKGERAAIAARNKPVFRLIVDL